MKQVYLLLCLAVVALLFGHTYEEICVKSDDTHGDGLKSCRTLEYCVTHSYFTNYSNFTFLPGQHHHNIVLALNNTRLLHLRGENSEVFIICNNSGFVFNNFENITIENLTFVSCGQNLTYELNKFVVAALGFVRGKHLTLQNVQTNYSTTGGLFCESINDINIQGSTFANSLTSTQTSANESAGNTIGYSKMYCNANNYELKINNSHFIDSDNHPKVGKCSHNVSRFAGGLFVVSFCRNVSINLTKMTMRSNGGCSGGNLAIILVSLKGTFHKPIVLQDSLITNGTASYGGGMLLEIVDNCLIYEPQLLNDIIQIRNVTFSNNTARNGGAMYIRTKESSKNCSGGNITLFNSIFNGNTLTHYGGIAIHHVNFVALGVFQHMVPQFLFIILNCTFKNNSVSKNNTWNNSGSGVILTKSTPHMEIVNTTITNNGASGLVAITSNLVISGTVHILSNNGASGGGMVLCSGAVLYFKNNTQLTIANNSVTHVGGGINAEYNCFQSEPFCFFQYFSTSIRNSATLDSLNISINLKNNTANYAGDDLYGGSVENCFMFKEADDKDTIYSIDVYKKFFHTDPSCTSVTSAPKSVCLCEDQLQHEPCNANNSHTTHRVVYPGGSFDLNLVLGGQRGGLTPGQVKATLHTNDVHFQYQIFDIKRNCTSNTLTIYSNCLNGCSHNVTLVALQSSDTSFMDHSDQFSSLTILVEVQKCPFGFKLSSHECKCKFIEQNGVTCNITNNNMEIHSPIWVGSVYWHHKKHFGISKSCFFQFYNTTINNLTLETINVSINLTNNIAHYAGDNLYGGSVHECYMLTNPHEHVVQSSIVFDHFFHLDPPNSVSSLPRRVCFCDTNLTHILDTCSPTSSQITVYPGETITLPLAIVGQLQGLTPGQMKVILYTDHSHFRSYKNTIVVDMNKKCENINLTIYSNYTDGSFNMTLIALRSSDTSFIQHLDNFTSILRMSVIMEKCIFGFILEKKFMCGCSYLGTYGVHCNITNTTMTIDNSSDTWLGSVDLEGIEKHFAVSKYCPPEYCTSGTRHLISLSSDFKDADSEMCLTHRTGVLCGQCKNGTSLILGSSDCTPNCSNYYLFLIPLFLVMGLFLVCFLFLLNLTVAEGTMSGVLFYANIFQINNATYFQGKSYGPLTSFLKVFIAWLNLDFGIPVCLYRGMNIYHKTWLQFAFPIYVWGLAGVIIYLSRKNSNIAALFGRNSVKVLATLILLSYTKMLRTILSIIRYYPVCVYNSSYEYSEIYHKWASDGNVTYMSNDHMPLFIAAIVAIVILLPYSLCLLFITRFYKYSHYKPLKWVNRWKPLFDAYIGPYTVSGCCWTGLLLTARVAISVISTAFYDTTSAFLLVVLIIVLLLLVAWYVVPHVYKKHSLNKLESASMVNLAILNIGTLWILHNNGHQEILTHLSLLVTVVLFSCIVVYHICGQMSTLDCIKIYKVLKRRPQISKPLNVPQMMNKTAELPPVAHFNEDRELLLAEED